MRFSVLKQQTKYSGRELRSGWVAEQTGLEGDVAVAFTGPCHVANEDLVDMDDAQAGTFIAAKQMAHVIIEMGCDIRTAVLRQRMLVAILCESLRELDRPVRRDGDDVYYGDRKLTVSIAAPSVGTCLIHLGINIDPDGAPVAAGGLAEMEINPRELLDTLLNRFSAELASCEHAEGKVRQVP